jgi:hypothetical protein
VVFHFESFPVPEWHTVTPGSQVPLAQRSGFQDEEVQRSVKWTYDRAVSLQIEHTETLNIIARSLGLHESLDARRLRAIMEDTSATQTSALGIDEREEQTCRKKITS